MLSKSIHVVSEVSIRSVLCPRIHIGIKKEVQIDGTFSSIKPCMVANIKELGSGGLPMAELTDRWHSPFLFGTITWLSDNLVPP